MLEICTKRLKLVPLDNYLLSIWLNDGREAMEEAMGLSYSDWLKDEFVKEETMQGLKNFWFPQTNSFFIDFFWYTTWEVILTDKNLSIGNLGFSGFPDLEGKTTVGYFIQKEYRNNGFATESLQGLIDWAKSEPALKVILAKTDFFNLPSQSVLINTGFKQVDSDKSDLVHKSWALQVENVLNKMFIVNSKIQ